MNIQQLAKDIALKYLEPTLGKSQYKTQPVYAFNRELLLQMGQLGFLGLAVPQTLGGTEQPMTSICDVMEELSAIEPGFCLSFLSHSMLFMGNLAKNASPFLSQKYLPKCFTGQWLGGMAMTEPMAGSDALGMETTAQDKGDHFILNGTKIFITNAPIGDVFLVYAKTGPQGRDFSAFVVESSFPGFHRGKALEKMGMDYSPTGELLFKDCSVPRENLVGEKNKALLGMMENLDSERLALAAMSVGIARSCWQHASRYALEREQFSKSIVHFSPITQKLADMFVAFETGKSYVHTVAKAMDGDPLGRHNQRTAAAKIYASRMATQCALDAIQILGGYGYSREFPVEKFMRDAKLLEIGGGTSEILQGVVVKEMMRQKNHHE